MKKSKQRLRPFYSAQREIFAKKNSYIQNRTFYQLDLMIAKQRISHFRTNNKCCALEYLRDIYFHQLDSESTHRLLRNFDDMKFFGSRENGVHWIVEVGDSLGLVPETLHLGAVIFDHFSSQVGLVNGIVELIATASLMIAVKLDHPITDIPTVRDYAYLMQYKHTTSDLIEVEKMILSLLEYDVNFVTSIDFLRIFNEMFEVTDDAQKIGEYFLEISLLNFETSAIRPSLQAVVACCLSFAISNELNNIEFVWTAKFQEWIPYEWPDVQRVMMQYIQSFGLMAIEGLETCLFKKYAETHKSIADRMTDLSFQFAILD